jgi:ribosomal protein S7
MKSKTALQKAASALKAATQVLADAPGDWASDEYLDEEAKSALVVAFETRIQKAVKPKKNAVRVLEASFSEALPQVFLSIALPGGGRKEVVAVISPQRAKKLAHALLVAAGEAAQKPPEAAPLVAGSVMSAAGLRKEKVTLKLANKTVQVDAEVIGSWAVHLDPSEMPDEDTQPGWVVTFLPTSQRLAWKASKLDARKVLQKVLKAVPDLVNAKSVDDITANIEAIKSALR